METMAYPDALDRHLSVAAEPRLYATVNQVDRQAIFRGTDLRRKPYLLVRQPIDAGPVLLGERLQSSGMAIVAA
jgi:hypothetical protein